METEILDIYHISLPDMGVVSQKRLISKLNSASTDVASAVIRE